MPLDRVLKGGRLVDGTGAPARLADVGIRDGRIAADRRRPERARRHRLRGARRVPGLHRHPQPLGREGARRSAAAHEGAAGDHAGGLRPGRHLRGPRARRRARRPGSRSSPACSGTSAWSGTGRRSASTWPGSCAAGPASRTSPISFPHGAMRQYVMGGDDRRADARALAAMQDLLRARPRPGGLRPLHRPHLPAVLLRGHGGADRARPRAGRASPSSRRPHAQRERPHPRRPGRDDPGGARVRLPGAHLPSQGGRTGELAARGGRGAAPGGRPPRRPSPHRRSVPLHRGQHAARRHPSAVGA